MKCSDKEWQHCRVEKMGCEGCIYNEKTADEMFEDLDYVLEVEYDIDELNEIDTETLILRYIKEEGETYIEFWNDETFSKIAFTSEKENGYITMQELQAIYKKCEELRMDRINRVAITGILYKGDKKLLYGAWEDLENFVEELKTLNPKWVDRRDFKVRDFDGYLMKEWRKK